MENLNVMDMLKSYNNDIDTKDLFVTSKQKEDVPKAPVPKVVDDTSWAPDASLLEGMEEMQQHSGVVYNKSEMKEEKKQLDNIVDEDAKEAALSSKNEMERIDFNINEAKKRHGISYLQIPEGYDQVNIVNAASDSNYRKAQEGIDKVFAELKELHPEFFVYEDESLNIKKSNNENSDSQDIHNEDSNVIDQNADVKILIDKTNIQQVAFSDEEIDKIKKARSVELNIVEANDIEYSQIKNIPDNMVERVLDKYIRKSNDVLAALPASKYRATFSGLSYPEMIDLENSFEINNADGELKKWSICFEHIHNQSIGPWESWVWYKDPETGKKMRYNSIENVPANIDRNNIHVVTKFMDFMMKTSFLDLDFMLWKILCATSMGSEIISINCKSQINGVPCKNHYDWVYRPAELLDMKSIPTVVLDEMKTTMEASGSENIMENYNSSMLRLNNIAKLPHSGIKVVFGHISGYDYMENIYENITSISELEGDPTIASRYSTYTQLTSVKAFLIPTGLDENGNEEFGKIDDIDTMYQIINGLDEVDWGALTELVKIMLSPYNFKFIIKDIICPKCKSKTNIEIENIMRLFLIVAQSLASVSVTLKRS